MLVLLVVLAVIVVVALVLLLGGPGYGYGGYGSGPAQIRRVFLHRPMRRVYRDAPTRGYDERVVRRYDDRP